MPLLIKQWVDVPVATDIAPVVGAVTNTPALEPIKRLEITPALLILSVPPDVPVLSPVVAFRVVP